MALANNATLGVKVKVKVRVMKYISLLILKGPLNIKSEKI
jgi:hypothetical protein